MRGVQPGPDARVRPARLALVDAAQRLRRERLESQRQDGPPAAVYEGLVAAGTFRTQDVLGQHFRFREVVQRHPGRGTRKRRQAQRAFLESAHHEGQVGHHGDAAQLPLAQRHLVRLRHAVPVAIHPEERDVVLLRLRRPKFRERFFLEERPVARPADARARDSDALFEPPKHRRGGTAHWIAVMAIGEILSAFMVQGAGRITAADGPFERRRPGTVVDGPELEAALLPIEVKLHAVVIEASGVEGVEHAAAAVFRWTVETA